MTIQLSKILGTIRGWEGDELMTLGEILHMGSVTVGPVDQNQKDRYFVLFSSTLLILSVSARMSGFIYEVRQREIKQRGHSKTTSTRQGRYLQ